ncbi:MAG: RelA/SpoT family protein [Tannerella sp.]|jgi:GTP pyrophosphokinase|nr:RelA/SpoT family protein [Tannerella sp.]
MRELKTKEERDEFRENVYEYVVQKQFEQLLSEYLNSNHRRKLERITKAYNFAKKAHEKAKRLDGRPYITHPLSVSQIVCGEMGLGSTSICAALLHDVVEDTEYEVEDIQNMFGQKIAQLVDGLTKISGEIFIDKDMKQIENFRKLLLTMSSDIRVILVKIADRLHNMRTLDSMRTDKQYKIAGETMFIYAPLAHRLGLFAIKTELEDLSFKYEHPDDFQMIKEKLKNSEESRQRLFENFAKPVHMRLQDLELTYDMKARVKSAYSIWNKMLTKGVPFEDIYDLFAIRIIFEPTGDVDEKNLCWDIYAAITDIYRTRPDRLRDWVSRPKANGYQALHLTIMGPDGQWIEIQIRSKRMDEIDEKGFAAHWKYKDNNTDEKNHIEEDTELDKWLHTITEILENPSPNTLDFLDTIKMNLFSSEIFVFTPKGELKTLPKGATALDFAYNLHTGIGDTCIGAKVNHHLVPLSHKLESGDQVEILTSRSQTPKVEWLNFVTTAKARTKIESVLRRERKELAKVGQEKVAELFRKSEVELNQSLLDKVTTYYGFSKREDFYYAVEKGEVSMPDNIRKILKDKSKSSILKYVKKAFGVGKKKDSGGTKTDEEQLANKKVFDKSKPYDLVEDAFGKRNYVVASCCKPIPGDDVFGFINDDGNVVVHKHTCNIGLRLKSSFGDRILSTSWSSHVNRSFEAMLHVIGIDAVGVLTDISRTISGYNVNIIRLLIETNDGVFDGKINLLVHDVEDIQKMCVAISKLKNIQSVSRIAE